MSDDEQLLDENNVDEALTEARVTAAAKRKHDDDTPFSDPDDVDPNPQSKTHPSTDSDIDEHERYDEGL